MSTLETMPPFVPGLQLSEHFYREAVKPLLDAHFPDLAYDAALIDSGSEVLGFDDSLSRDHHWGPRISIFLSADDHAHHAAAIDRGMRAHLPYHFQGYSTSFEPVPNDGGVLRLEERTSGEVNHRVEVTTVKGFVAGYLGIDPTLGMSAVDWLTLPQQKLRTITQGALYHSGLGDVARLRGALAYFPRDLWLYLMAAGWTRISQEEAFVGRTAATGDKIGSQVIAARLVRDLMMLAFLQERVYAPYPKWFGTGFAQLKIAPELSPALADVLRAPTYPEREAALGKAYRLLAVRHNALGITTPLSETTSYYHERPYLVIHGDRFSEVLLAEVQDAEVKRIAAHTMAGSIDQFSDSTDMRENARLRRNIRHIYALDA